MSEFNHAVIEDFLKDLFSFKQFYDDVTSQIAKEFELELQGEELRKFILKKLKRFVPIDMFFKKYYTRSKLDNKTSTNEITKDSGENVNTQIGDYTMSMDGYSQHSVYNI